MPVAEAELSLTVECEEYWKAYLSRATEDEAPVSPAAEKQKLWKMREGKDIGLFITLVPKFNNNVFLFVGLKTLATFIEFWLVGSISVQTV